MNNQELDAATHKKADSIARHLVSKFETTSIHLKEESRLENDRFTKALKVDQEAGAKGEAEVRLVVVDLARELAKQGYPEGQSAAQCVTKAMAALRLTPEDMENLNKTLVDNLWDWKAPA